jgi:hypothetical protein
LNVQPSQKRLLHPVDHCQLNIASFNFPDQTLVFRPQSMFLFREMPGSSDDFTHSYFVLIGGFTPYYRNFAALPAKPNSYGNEAFIMPNCKSSIFGFAATASK